MDSNNRQVEISLTITLLTSIQKMHGALLDHAALRNTTKVVMRRYRAEGMGFLTKTLPRLGKAFDKALAEHTPLNASSLGFAAIEGTSLPRFLGELFRVVLDSRGVPLRDAHAEHVSAIRQVLYCCYKYALPYDPETKRKAIDGFIATESDLSSVESMLEGYTSAASLLSTSNRGRAKLADPALVVRRARVLLQRVCQRLDLSNIYPSHGPGAVSTKEKLWEKYEWNRVSKRITDVWPLDTYFYASAGHVCDAYREFSKLTDTDHPAEITLVPKDSRGPRIISKEPVDQQWIQQGLMRAIVRSVEHSSLTKWNVFFTNQQPNQFGALLGSQTGNYATLDLKEASDRVSVSLVNALWPDTVLPYLHAARSLSTVLPDGQEIQLKKFAPMGSALCFPIMALTVWAILTAAAPDRDTRQGILVYGDDVVVKSAYAEDAIEQLTRFGLRLNPDKCCTKGSFRESCGVDAFKGQDVTPVKIKTVWSSSRSPESYSAWIAYANRFYDTKYYDTYYYIVEQLHAVYGEVPADDMHLACPTLRVIPESMRPTRFRTNHALQKRQWRVWGVKNVRLEHETTGWVKLLRFFTEACSYDPIDWNTVRANNRNVFLPLVGRNAFSVSLYTPRGRSKLRKTWA